MTWKTSISLSRFTVLLGNQNGSWHTCGQHLTCTILQQTVAEQANFSPGPNRLENLCDVLEQVQSMVSPQWITLGSDPSRQSHRDHFVQHPDIGGGSFESCWFQGEAPFIDWTPGCSLGSEEFGVPVDALDSLSCVFWCHSLTSVCSVSGPVAMRGCTWSAMVFR